jgi:DNA helicase TIP49 (TBP-interacting protein)
MRLQTATQIITSTLRRNPGQAIYISGAPGLGKTSMVYDVAKALGIPDDRVLLFRPSLRDPVDLNA